MQNLNLKELALGVNETTTGSELILQCRGSKFRKFHENQDFYKIKSLNYTCQIFKVGKPHVLILWVPELHAFSMKHHDFRRSKKHCTTLKKLNRAF